MTQARMIINGTFQIFLSTTIDYSAKSALERDVTRQEFLESKGWQVERVWSRNWWRDPEKEINRIHQRIQELRKIKPAYKDTLLVNGEEKDRGVQQHIPIIASSPTAVQNHEQQNQESEFAQEVKIIQELIKKGESDMLEFKSSMIWDYKLNKPNKTVLWQPILKNIVAFMKDSTMRK